MPDATETPARGGTKLLDGGHQAPWQDTNRQPFLFRHNLANHPLFEISRIARLAEKSVMRGGSAIAREHSELPREEVARRLVDKIHDLEKGNHWTKVPFVDQLDPEFKELLESLLSEVEVLSGVKLRDRMTWSALTVFMNSPRLVVPYHFDHDTNFLMQIRGEKTVFLWDPKVLSQDEIENFYRGDSMAGRYRPELEALGKPHPLSPGVGVHHPALAPHMIRNGDQVSVSLSFYYVLREQNDRARVYQSNFLMRKLGLKPRPPGISPFSDRVKTTLINAISTSNPESWHDMLYSGMDRVSSIYKLAGRLRGKGEAPKPAGDESKERITM